MTNLGSLTCSEASSIVVNVYCLIMISPIKKTQLTPGLYGQFVNDTYKTAKSKFFASIARQIDSATSSGKTVYLASPSYATGFVS
jgi:hypothetical protein